ncbi:MAG: hypothetical protein HY954_05235 [Deltaproteobacteria bacterium]|nr:hypothetical protein [Deltaproteobacteria bacterium]
MESVKTESRIDIDSIMGRIKENVRRKKEEGVYSDSDITAVANVKMSVEKAPGADRLSEQINNLRKDYDFTNTGKISSHRPVTGTMIVSAKKAMLSVLKKSAHPMWDKQVGFNFHLIELLDTMAEEISRLKAENAFLKESLEKGLEKIKKSE